MKYKGTINYRIATLSKLIRALKLSKSFIIQRITKKLKDTEHLKEGQAETLEARLKSVREVPTPSLKLLAMLILTHYLEVDFSTHFQEIQEKVTQPI